MHWMSQWKKAEKSPKQWELSAASASAAKWVDFGHVVPCTEAALYGWRGVKSRTA